MAIIIAILLLNGAPRLLGSLMLAVAAIPVADGVIVLRSGGRQIARSNAVAAAAASTTT